MINNPQMKYAEAYAAMQYTANLNAAIYSGTITFKKKKVTSFYFYFFALSR